MKKRGRRSAEQFRRINPGLTISGEQYLYYLLRSPAQDAATYEVRRDPQRH